LTPTPTADISIKAKLAPSLSSLLANLLVPGLLLLHNLLALSHIPTTLQSAIVLRSDELKELLLVHSRYEMVMKLKELSWQRAQ
jgi:hypothetical protein